MAGVKETEDPLLQQIGTVGKWQVVTFIFLSLFCIPVAWQLLAVAFHAPSGVDHWCKQPPAFSNWTAEQWRQYSAPFHYDKYGEKQWDNCRVYARNYTVPPPNPDNPPDPPDVNKTVTCPKLYRIHSRWDFDHSFYSWTILEHFGLVCEYEYLLHPIRVSYMVGLLIGVFFGGMISDRFGRRPTILVLLGCLVVTAITVAFSGTVMVYMVLRFLLSVTIIAEYTTIFVFAMETVGGRWRIIMGMLFQLPFSLGFISLAGIAYSITNWQHLQLAISVPIVIFFLYYWAVPESPRWLLAAGKIDRASALIESITEINGREYDPNIQLIPPNEARNHVYVKELLRLPSVRYRTINIWLNWFANAFVYYSMLFVYLEVGGDIYLNTLIGGAVEIPAYLLSIGVCLLLGRRWPICIMMVGAGVFLLATIGVERGYYAKDWPVIILTMLARFCITSSFGIIYVFSSEVFPTVLRNTGLGSSSTFARIGTILAALTPALVKPYFHAPAILLGLIAITAGLAILLIPETAGKKMPDTLREAEYLGSDVEIRNKRPAPPLFQTPSMVVSPPEEEDGERMEPLKRGPEAVECDNPAFELEEDEDRPSQQSSASGSSDDQERRKEGQQQPPGADEDDQQIPPEEPPSPTGLHGSVVLGK